MKFRGRTPAYAKAMAGKPGGGGFAVLSPAYFLHPSGMTATPAVLADGHSKNEDEDENDDEEDSLFATPNVCRNSTIGRNFLDYHK